MGILDTGIWKEVSTRLAQCRITEGATISPSGDLWTMAGAKLFASLDSPKVGHNAVGHNAIGRRDASQAEEKEWTMDAARPWEDGGERCSAWANSQGFRGPRAAPMMS